MMELAKLRGTLGLGEGSEVSPSNAVEVIRSSRRDIRDGGTRGIDLDEIEKSSRLSIREKAYCWLVALSLTEGADMKSMMRGGIKVRGSGGKLSREEIALWCGFEGSEISRVVSDSLLSGMIREYYLRAVTVHDNRVEDLRNIALSRLNASAVAVVGDILDYGKGKPIPEGDYYGYIDIGNGEHVRIRQLSELPDHVGLAIKSFRLRNVGSSKQAVLVPEIEFYDAMRASELLLKYTGDIGSKSTSDEILGMAGSIADMIDRARRRSNSIESVEEAAAIEEGVVESEFISMGEDEDGV